LQPALQQSENYINQSANQRGLLTSGIPIGQMGTAGVNLAIQEAQGRMNAYQQNMANAQSLTGNIQQTGQQNLQNLGNLYSQQQTAGLQASGRQATAAQNNAQYQAYPYQAQLGSYYGGQAANQALPGQSIGALGTLGSNTNWLSMFNKPGTSAGGTSGNALSGATDYSNPYGTNYSDVTNLSSSLIQ
jgi:hypothetical protein